MFSRSPEEIFPPFRNSRIWTCDLLVSATTLNNQFFYLSFQLLLTSLFIPRAFYQCTDGTSGSYQNWYHSVVAIPNPLIFPPLPCQVAAGIRVSKVGANKTPKWSEPVWSSQMIYYRLLFKQYGCSLNCCSLEQQGSVDISEVVGTFWILTWGSEHKKKAALESEPIEKIQGMRLCKSLTVTLQHLCC